jgi:peptidase M23-like protein
VTSRWRAAVVVLGTTAAIGAAAVWHAGAQLPVSPTTTSPPPPPPESSTTTEPTPPTLPGSSSTTPPATTAPKPAPAPAPVPAAPVTTTSTVPGSGPQVVPPDAWAQINAVKRSPANSTALLLEALSALQDFGLTPQEAALVGMGHFPVAGAANFSDDWLMPRFTPSFHMHQGNDIFAAMNTPVRAVADGVVRFGEEPVGGKAVYITTSDGTYYYCAHLNDWPQNIQSGQSVKQGTVVGLVGNTGDAQGGSSHCHFEIHPKGGAAVDPKPFLDAWLTEAIADVPKLVAAYQANVPRAIADAGFMRRFDAGGDGMFSAPMRPGGAPLLWASSVNPNGGALRLAEVEVAQAAGSVDWDGLFQRQQAAVSAWQQADDRARAVLRAMSPAALAPLL